MPLSSIKGTGPDGSIVKADVEEYLGIIQDSCLIINTFVTLFYFNFNLFLVHFVLETFCLPYFSCEEKSNPADD